MNTQKHDYVVIRQIASTIGVLLLAMLFLLPKMNAIAGSCGDLESYEIPTLESVTTTNDGIEVSWTPVTDDRFLQYRVIASKTDSTPEGDVNGYLVKLTNKNASGYTIDGTVPYSFGDFYGFEKNTQYYIAIAVEYNCGYITESEPIAATFPDLDPLDLITPEFTATWGSKGITLLWDSIDHENLEDIRIVASQIDPNPSYPDNGYVAIVDTNTIQYLIDNEASYSITGFDTFIPGQQYYVALTARYVVNDTDYYATSEAQRVTYEGPGSALPYIRIPTVTAAKATDTGFVLEWNAIDDYRLTEYAVMIDRDASPSYPNDGFVKVVSKDATSYTISNKDSFATADFPYLEYGVSYRFSVTAVYGDEHRSSVAYKHAYIGPQPSNISQFHDLNIAKEGADYKATWVPVNDRRLAKVYFVISDSDESPGYNDDAWYTQITNAAGATVPNMSTLVFQQNTFSQNNITKSLVDDTTYYAMLTFVFRDGSTFTSQATSFTYDADALVVSPQVTLGSDDNSTDNLHDTHTTPPSVANQTLSQRLQGYVLLQVEGNGEAWYVDPASQKRYYLKDPDTAFTALRNFGLGISNSDLAKIPIGVEDRFGGDDSDGDGLIDKLEEGVGTDPQNADTDGDGYRDAVEVQNNFNPRGAGAMVIDQEIVNRLRGRIVLQVEDRGQAWYINPQNGKRYYMKDGQAAFDILRYLSLGISNTDLAQVSAGELAL